MSMLAVQTTPAATALTDASLCVSAVFLWRSGREWAKDVKGRCMALTDVSKGVSAVSFADLDLDSKL